MTSFIDTNGSLNEYGGEYSMDRIIVYVTLMYCTRTCYLLLHIYIYVYIYIYIEIEHDVAVYRGIYVYIYMYIDIVSILACIIG